jgi:endonuclease/exonuclease/phosphatase family metal-dependent hydrolase
MFRILLMCCHVAFVFTAGAPAADEASRCAGTSPASVTDSPAGSRQTLRWATFNVALHRNKPGQLAAEVQAGGSAAAARIAEVIQRVRPDVILLNEVDFDADGVAVGGLCKNYLEVGQNGAEPIHYPHVYIGPVNSGVDSGLDQNGDGKLHTPDDAYGFGLFPGQYGMVILSRLPIGSGVRTFQKFLWRDMPGPLWPVDPESGAAFYSPPVQAVFRLSSKSHWDVPIVAGDRTIHMIAAHPTPPVFDGPEDRNGRRNHDEIRLIADYLRGAEYIYDDQGVAGGLSADASFVVAGDLNADPCDGDSRGASVRQLLDHVRIDSSMVPISDGARRASETSGQANGRHQGDPAADTGDFGDKSVGNLRLDYVLPSRDLKVVASGVYWPTPEDPSAPLAGASDHHLVWIDIERP